MTNSATVLSLVAQPVPQDRECVRTLSDILEGVQDYVTIGGLSSQVGGTSLPNTNNTAAQALEVANDALSLAQDLQAEKRERRSSQTATALSTGDSYVPISWSPAMPNTFFEVRITLMGPASHPSAYFGWRLVNNTITPTSVQVAFENIPAGWSFFWVCEQL